MPVDTRRSAPAVIPVHVADEIDSEPALTERKASTRRRNPCGSLEIELPGGRHVRIRGTVDMSAAAVAVLDGQAVQAEEGAQFAFLGPEPLENLRGPWGRAKKAAGLADDPRINDLRHSFASALANLGTPLNEIGAILGHSQLGTTLRYARHAQQRLVGSAQLSCGSRRSNAPSLDPVPNRTSARSELGRCLAKFPSRSRAVLRLTTRVRIFFWAFCGYSVGS